MKLKKNTVKLFKLDWSFFWQISNNQLLEKISFQKQINWWLGNLKIKFSWDFFNWTVVEFWKKNVFEVWEETLIVKIFEETYWVPNWVQIYQWYTINIKQTYKTWKETEIEVFWIASSLTQWYMVNTDTPVNLANYEFTLTSWNNYFWITYDWTIKKAIEVLHEMYKVDFWDNMMEIWENNFTDVIWNIEIKKHTYFDFIKLILSKISHLNYYFYVDWNWLLNLREKAYSPEFWFTWKKDINKVEVNNSLKKQKNLIITSDDTLSFLNKEDTSIAAYWRKTHFADFWENEDWDKKWKKQLETLHPKLWDCKLEINNSFQIIKDAVIWNDLDWAWNSYSWTFWELWWIPIWTQILEPWRTIRLLNLDVWLDKNLQIVKIQYWNERITLELETYNNYLLEVKDGLFYNLKV